MMRDVGRLLLIAGAVLVLAGLVMTLLGRMGIGKLPGDILIRRENFTFYFPIVTSIVLSVLLSLLVWLFRRG
jgi:uncharacterized membrane protein